MMCFCICLAAIGSLFAAARRRVELFEDVVDPVVAAVATVTEDSVLSSEVVDVVEVVEVAVVLRIFVCSFMALFISASIKGACNLRCTSTPF